MQEIGSYDAKTRLPKILRQVAAGEGFTITNRGRPIADLMPSRQDHRTRAETAISNILKAKHPPLSDSVLAELKQFGRK
ncbi:MAG TPA: type II toxin-antitoxin system prevent-host-death family antitoxin [Gammaproteobacteria bacterium]|nr:type II toxin-antitoxin system prevent-host-death family antitoxin [Gammaproteobacteria bacterium]